MQRDLEVEFNEVLMIFFNLLPATLLIAPGKLSSLLAIDSCIYDILIILQEDSKLYSKKGLKKP
jgi:hypothetical protein